MKNATNRYQLFPAETLKGVWGSCGSHHNTSGLAADNRLPPPSQRRARRVGGKPNVVFSESWALQLGTPVLGHLEKFHHLDVVSAGWNHPVYLEWLISCGQSIIKYGTLHHCLASVGLTLKLCRVKSGSKVDKLTIDNVFGENLLWAKAQGYALPW